MQPQPIPPHVERQEQVTCRKLTQYSVSPRLCWRGDGVPARPDLTVPPALQAGFPLQSPSTAGQSLLLRETAEPITDWDPASIASLLDRLGGAKLVLLGEATHGTSEFYRMRTHITQQLIEHHDFKFVAVEADWPDAALIDRYVMGDAPPSEPELIPFSRFPGWMWRNTDVASFIDWLRSRNLQKHREQRVGFHGLDLYSMFTSMAAVLAYLDDVDPIAADVARERYDTLAPWRQDPSAYGHAVLTGRYESSEQAVCTVLRDLLVRRCEYSQRDGVRFFDASQNARLVANAEHYYRAMYYASPTSWNLRDSHMFDVLRSLMEFYGPDARGVVWEHNSHVGDARATEMSLRGEHNLGQLCRQEYDHDVYIVGFGTDHGEVTAASGWGAPAQTIAVRPALDSSYERLFHDTDIPALALFLHDPARAAVREELLPPRLERAIGVIYRPETERLSHYFNASLPEQFDAYVWFDETHAVTPLRDRQLLTHSWTR